MNWRKTGLVIALDILFILLLINLRFVTANINGWFFSFFRGLEPIANIIAVTSLVILGSLFLINIDSFFKYLILSIIQGMFKETSLKNNRLFSLIKLNWIIIGPMMIVYMAIFILTISDLAREFSAGISNPFLFFLNLLLVGVFLLILLNYLYTLINLFHFIFLKERNLRKILKFCFIYSLRLYGGLNKTGLLAITVVTIYFLLLFNRINFCRIRIKTKAGLW